MSSLSSPNSLLFRTHTVYTHTCAHTQAHKPYKYTTHTIHTHTHYTYTHKYTKHTHLLKTLGAAIIHCFPTHRRCPSLAAEFAFLPWDSLRCTSGTSRRWGLTNVTSMFEENVGSLSCWGLASETARRANHMLASMRT